ncbi:MAG: FxSxx-COOH system tetratricopeptide repeat protein [Ktedonobacteraceae bacterium]
MKKADEAIPNNKLKQERVERNWTQGQVAEKIGTSRVNVSRWEHGRVLPDMHFRQQLCELFGKNAYELGLLPEHASVDGDQPVQYAANTRDGPSTVPATPSPLWHVPYRRNPFFTGREEVLQLLHDALHRHSVTALIQSVAISGLGGIGKTQTAIEYAYRYRDHYQAVFWLKADSSEVLIADMITLAELLGLPERQQQDQQRIIEAVKVWLNTHHDWLLLLDNVEDPTTLHNLLPSNPGGSILLTTRSQVTGTIAERVGLEQMEPEEGALFLLRRAGLVARDACLEEISPAVRGTAQDISHLLGGLPLALDQAGAYIEETGCSLAHYLTCYQTRQAMLLNRRGNDGVDHPMSVATTFSLALEQVEHVNPAAADLLRLSAFLHPDAIPEELIIKGACELGPVLQSTALDAFAFDAAIKDLRTFSLLQRNAEAKTLTIHRLVQVVVRDNMDEDRERQWAEQTVRVVNRAFPEVVDAAVWSQCQRFLSHALACQELIDRWKLVFPEAGRLLHQAGIYLREYAQFARSQSLLEKALSIYGQTFGPVHSKIANALMDVGELLCSQDKYTQAEPLLQRALIICEQTLGPDHPAMAENLTILACVSYERGKYAEAKPLFQRALAIREQALGPTHPDVGHSLNNLAMLYYRWGKYAEAEPLLQRALAIRERALEPAHPYVAESLNNLARFYTDLGKYAEAEPLFLRALAIREGLFGSMHPNVAQSLNTLARLYYHQNKYAEAEPLFLRALAIREQTLGATHPRVALCLNYLADLYWRQGKTLEAENLYQRALFIYESTRGLDHPDTATCLHALARLYSRQGDDDKAEPLYQRALAIWEKALEPDHPSIISCLENYAELLRKTHGESEAARYEARVRQLRARETLEQPTLSARQKRAETSHQ